MLTAAILFQTLPGSVKLTCPENLCHIRRRLENWKPEDLAYQGYTYIALNSIRVTGLFQAVDTVNDFVNEAVKVMYEKDEAR